MSSSIRPRCIYNGYEANENLVLNGLFHQQSRGYQSSMKSCSINTNTNRTHERFRDFMFSKSFQIIHCRLRTNKKYNLEEESVRWDCFSCFHGLVIILCTISMFHMADMICKQMHWGNNSQREIIMLISEIRPHRYIYYHHNRRLSVE